MSMSSSTYKPSPLSFGSPRSSPFRRPESPASPSTVRSTTPTPSPKKSQTPIQSPSKSNTGPPAAEDTWTPRGLTPVTAREAPTSPTRKGNVASTTSKTGGDGGNALSRLHPNQVRELREGFQLLDRDSDGQVTRDDVADALKNL
ncbi:MAG: hypothetical protein M1833_002901, partial [Piccolia ochrophora]